MIDLRTLEKNKISSSLANFVKTTLLKLTKKNDVIFKFNDCEINVTSGKITFYKEFNIHCKENLSITSDKHVIIMSGRDLSEDGETLHSVWTNPDVNEDNEPILVDKKNPKALTKYINKRYLKKHD